MCSHTELVRSVACTCLEAWTLRAPALITTPTYGMRDQIKKAKKLEAERAAEWEHVEQERAEERADEIASDLTAAEERADVGPGSPLTPVPPAEAADVPACLRFPSLVFVLGESEEDAACSDSPVDGRELYKGFDWRAHTFRAATLHELAPGHQQFRARCMFELRTAHSRLIYIMCTIWAACSSSVNPDCRSPG